MLRKMDPPRVMTPREQRGAILGIAKALGAEVVYRKKAA
jgi:anti-sigma regulatory factor (Ser/Thr protein kinase)